MQAKFIRLQATTQQAFDHHACHMYLKPAIGLRCQRDYANTWFTYLLPNSCWNWLWSCWLCCSGVCL